VQSTELMQIVSLITSVTFDIIKIGEAAKAKAFDYGGPEVKSLTSFLLQAVGG